MSGVHDGPKIGCDTGCILGPAWVSPTALQPATRGPVTSNAVPSVISIYPIMWSFGGLCKKSPPSRCCRGQVPSGMRDDDDDDDDDYDEKAGVFAASAVPLGCMFASSRLPSRKFMEVKRHRNCHRPSQGWHGRCKCGRWSRTAGVELVVSLREGTDVLVLACLSVCYTGFPEKEGYFVTSVVLARGPLT